VFCAVGRVVYDSGASPRKVKVIEMAKKLYVGNLSYGTTNDSLKQVFQAAGEVSEATILMDKMTGKSRGFGFVTMPNDEEAVKAIDMFHGKEVDGRTLTVNEARPMAPREDRPRRSGGFGGGRRDM
jgi:cold-inducible RNA-binding protein